MTTTTGNRSQGWQQYYGKIPAKRPAREFLRTTQRCFQSVGDAIDLGCGTGAETQFLLQRGWHVLAIDQQVEAIEIVQANTPLALTSQLQTQVASFESVDLPTADLIWAGLSLPFCQPQQFARLWANICSALRSGGRFAGDFFGTHHAWADSPQMTFHSKAQLLSLCEPLHIEYLQEGEGEQLTALGGSQHWHMFTIRARKP